jgi:uncharacterized protein YkwD
MNQQRAQALCAPLISDPQLEAAADRHAKNLAANGWPNDHNDSDGTVTPQLMDLAGYKWAASPWSIRTSDAAVATHFAI